ncbi:MAG: hypothetical protein DSO09_05175 [Candidatus Methanomethylicota archaeon]|jgi:uncharacterized protein (UPF0147 family)|uniref:UPF0147 protein DSO09_05175 n=1 Tax=Thermoproteota archaeon TaxID=2056631 RepID=A0A520KGN6_9CREN|nr:MAG: UPF0147 family protein [Candidatus Verstraetearchaeota archaeon]TDA38057.1 MAG: hypothetical protein DSO09_05175 [Candidatus Verstraetearchaeota archaeon]
MSSIEKMNQAITILQRVVGDTGIPRNIRRAASEAIKILQGTTYSNAVRAANAISILEECTQDPNIPLFARTAIWQAISLLEQVTD